MDAISSDNRITPPPPPPPPPPAPPPPPPPAQAPAAVSGPAKAESFQPSQDLREGPGKREELPNLAAAFEGAKGPEAPRAADGSKAVEEAKPAQAGAGEKKQPGFHDVVGQSFGSWDADKNGHLTEAELEKAFRNKDNSVDQKSALATLRGRQGQLEEIRNDETGDENDGISRGDLADLKKKDPELAARVEDQFGLEREVRTELAQKAKPPGFQDVASRNFGAWDRDRNGAMTEQEIAGALRDKNLTAEQRSALQAMRGRTGAIEELSNDEWGDENDGMTRKDLAALKSSGQLGRDVDGAYRAGVDSKVDKPADLKDKIGTRDYYRERYKDFVRRNPEDKPPDYYLNYGLKYFDRFQGLKGQVSPTTQGWVDRTGVLLQNKMDSLAQSDPRAFARLERDPEAFKAFAYGTHPSAYLEAGLRDVPYGDRIKIGLTPDKGDLLTWDGVSQAVQTGVTVAGQDAYDAGSSALDAAGRKVGEVRDAAVRNVIEAGKERARRAISDAWRWATPLPRY